MNRSTSRRCSGRAWIICVGIITALGLAGCADPGGAGSDTEAGQSPGSAECSAPASAKQRDRDLSDTAETPFERTDPNGPVTVSFAVGTLSAVYEDRVRRAVAYWNQSPCLDGKIVTECPSGGNCVRVEAHDRKYLKKRHPGDGWGDTDGSFGGVERKGWRVGGRILLNTTMMDRATDRGSTATITHEIGHAYGLIHRKDKSDLMNAYTDDRTSPQPDATDFWNLRVIYR